MKIKSMIFIINKDNFISLNFCLENERMNNFMYKFIYNHEEIFININFYIKIKEINNFNKTQIII